MGTDTTPDLAALRSDMQDVLYGAIYHNRYDTSAEAMDALLPIVERYAAAKTANELNLLAAVRDVPKPQTGYEDACHDVAIRLRARAAELAGRDGDTTHD